MSFEKMCKILFRRKNELKKRIENKERSPNSLQYDKAEYSALTKVLDIVSNFEQKEG